MTMTIAPTTARITTPFSALTTAAEAIDGVDLTGKRAIVTGGASGIGIETARALVSAGAEVTIAVRDIDAGERTVADIARTVGGRAVRIAPLDLSIQSSIDEFLDTWQGPLHILINNAGVMARPLARSTEGWEMQFATNHLGHFHLASGLHDSLAAAGGARVVSVSSSAHLGSGVVFDDVHFDVRAYDPWAAYAQSKTANVLFGVEGSRRWADDGITINALMPGAIATNLQRHVTPEELQRMRDAAGGGAPAWKNPMEGAATSIVVATSPLLEGIGGRYFEDGNEAEANQPGTRRGVAAHALDPEAAEQLWDLSERAVGDRYFASNR